MDKDKNIKLFEEKTIRTRWDAEAEKWYFSIIDVCGVLAESDNPQVYWRVLKKRLLDEGNETVTNCNGLKMLAKDGKMRFTDVAGTSVRAIAKQSPTTLSCGMMATDSVATNFDQVFVTYRTETIRKAL